MRGFTLLELMISIFLLGLLLSAVFVIFFQGAKAWRQSDAQSDIQQQGAILLGQLSKEIESSCSEGVSLGPQSIGLLSAHDSNGQFQFTNAGSPAWSGYVIFYKDAEAVLRRVDLMAPSQVTPARPIESTEMGSGLNPLNTYLLAGRPVARMVEDFTLSLWPNERGLHAKVLLKNALPNIPRAVHLQLDSSIVFRN